MKRFLIFTAVAAFLCGSFFQVKAKTLQDQEYRRVIVTLTSGEKVEGYLHRGWHAESSFMKKENYSFKITKTPEDKEPIKYTADEVICIDYAETTEANPDGIRWEAHQIASPSIANRYNTVRRLICLNKTGRNATVYWWKTWEWNQVGNIRRRELVTHYGILFHNDPDQIVFPYSLVTTMLMDKQHPGLKDFCKNWFKGAEGKARKKEAKQDETWMLDMYDAYLAGQASR